MLRLRDNGLPQGRLSATVINSSRLLARALRYGLGMSIVAKFEAYIAKTEKEKGMTRLRGITTSMDVDGDGYLSFGEINRINHDIPYEQAIGIFTKCNTAISRSDASPVDSHLEMMQRMGTYNQAKIAQLECFADAPFVKHMSADEHKIALELSDIQRREVEHLRKNGWMMPAVEFMAPGEMATINALLVKHNLPQLHPDYVAQFKEAVLAEAGPGQVASAAPEQFASAALTAPRTPPMAKPRVPASER